MKNVKEKAKYWSKKILKYFFISTISVVIIYRFVPVFFTPLMFIRVAEQALDGKPLKLKRDWEPIENISKNLPLAVVSSEDQKFTEHFGFDFEAMQKAFKSNKKGKRIKGGSTITQQVAKNVFLWPGRSYVRKLFEAYFTVLIEIFWSKERIMEVYLNVCEMGNGVYGAEAASWYYFDCSAADLSKGQAAWIASVLPNPRKYDPKNPSNYLQRRQEKIKRQMRQVEEVEL